MEKWQKGQIDIPNARDLEVAKTHPGGHAILVVGYNNKERVYYFKNSWGTGNFGIVSDILGAGTTDGYGTIPYEYAHKYGVFYDVYQTDAGRVLRGPQH